MSRGGTALKLWMDMAFLLDGLQILLAIHDELVVKKQSKLSPPVLEALKGFHKEAKYAKELLPILDQILER
jgi:hypothetical protein